MVARRDAFLPLGAGASQGILDGLAIVGIIGGIGLGVGIPLGSIMAYYHDKYFWDEEVLKTFGVHVSLSEGLREWHRCFLKEGISFQIWDDPMGG